MDALAAADPVTSELLGVMSAWETAIGLNKPITTATIMRNLDHPPMPKREDFGGDSAKWTTACNAVRDAWNDLAATINAAAAPHGGKATAKNLGEWLGRHSKRITSGRRFVSQQPPAPRRGGSQPGSSQSGAAPLCTMVLTKALTGQIVDCAKHGGTGGTWRERARPHSPSKYCCASAAQLFGFSRSMQG